MTRHYPYELRRQRRQRLLRQKIKRRIFASGIVIIGCAVGLVGFVHHAQAPFAYSHLPQVATNEDVQSPLIVTPTWPEAHVAAAAIGAEGHGTLTTYGDTEVRPIASIAKVITSLVLIEKYKLQPGESGPDISFTLADEALYNEYFAKNGSIIPAKAGQSMSLRHAIEAMILPSANNIADSAVIWAFGSMEEYHRHANALLQHYGLKDTVVGGDASGFDPATQSTTRDLVKLGEIALNTPALMEIASLPEVELPGVGTIPNYNRLVSQHGYTGLKPGDTDEAGRTLLFTTTHTIDGEKLNLIGVVLGVENPLSPYDVGFTMMESAKATLSYNE